MPLRKAFWDTGSQTDYQGHDVHVIRNNTWSGSIGKALIIESDVGNVYQKTLDDYLTNTGTLDTDIKIVITTSLNGSKVVKTGPASKQTYDVYGVTFDGSTCKVKATTFSNPTGSGNIIIHKPDFNFHVKIEISNNTNPSQFPVITKFFRVHVHDDISKAWLTPSILTLEKMNNINRFSVYAKFSDGTIGDISHHPGFDWPGSGGIPEVMNTSNQKVVNFGAKGNMNVVIATVDQYTVNAKLDNTAFAKTSGTISIDSAKIIMSDIWTTPTPWAARILESESSRPDAINILFIADGYENGLNNVFYENATAAAKYMIEDSTAQPWNMLSKKMIKYWAMFLKSRQRGPSCLNEVVPFHTFKESTLNVAQDYSGSGPWIFDPNITYANFPSRFDTVAMGVDEYVSMADLYLTGDRVCPIFELNVDATKNPGTQMAQRKIGFRPTDLSMTPPGTVANGLVLSTLISIVGLPTPKDGHSSVTETGLREKWNQLYSSSITTWGTGTPTVQKDVHRFWIEMQDRRVLNERDTVMGSATGSKPRMYDTLGAFPGSRTIGMHPFRNSRLLLDNEILSKVVNASGSSTTINAWTTPPPSPAIDSARFVALFSFGTRYAGTNHGEYIAVSVSDGNDLIIEPAATTQAPNLQGWEIVPKAYSPGNEPKDIPVSAKGTVAHEFGHAVGLGDEYGNIVADLKNDFDALALTNSMGNIMPHSSVTSVINNISQIQGSNLEWRYFRHKAAGVLLTQPVTTTSVPESGHPANGFTYYKFDMRLADADSFNHTLADGKTLVKYDKRGTLRFRKRNLPRAIAWHASNNPTGTQHNWWTIYSPPLEYITQTALANNMVRMYVRLSSGGSGLSFLGLGNWNANDVFAHFMDSEYLGIGKVWATNGSNTLNGVGTLFTGQFEGPGAGTSAIKYRVVINTGTTLEQILANKTVGNTFEISAVTTDTALTTALALPALGSSGAPLNFAVVPANECQELFHDSFRIAMNFSKKPFSKELANADDVTYAGGGVQNPTDSQVKVPSNIRLFPWLDSPENKNMVVGLYNGAQDYNYGGYHATGTCAMRNNDPGKVSGFCPVCRYVMVDFVDPSCHGKNNEYLDTIYPKFKP